MPVEAQQYFVEMMQKGFTPNAFSFRSSFFPSHLISGLVSTQR